MIGCVLSQLKPSNVVFLYVVLHGNSFMQIRDRYPDHPKYLMNCFLVRDLPWVSDQGTIHSISWMILITIRMTI